MSTQKEFTPFTGMCPLYPELGEHCSSFLTVDGTERKLSWEKQEDGGYKAITPYGVFSLELHPFASGVKILSRWERNRQILPEKVCFSPLVFRDCKTDHVFFCGEKMGRCLSAVFPLAKERVFEGRYYSSLTRAGVSFLLHTPLDQRYDNVFRGKGSGLLLEEWRTDFEFLHNDLPAEVEFDPVTFQWGSGVEILEEYAQSNAGTAKDFSVPPPCGWNSWDYYRWTVTEEEVLKNASFIASDPVLKQHVKRIIMDDGWQYCYGEWEPNPNFPSGMKILAEKIRSLGFEPGLWLAPSIVEPHSRIAQLDYEMLSLSEGGQPCLSYKCMERRGFLLDPTVEKSRLFLTELFDRYASMGYRYFKLDFLASTMTAKRFHDRNIPRCRILPLLMDAIDRGIKDRAEILGCNYPFYTGNRFVRAVRVGGDIHSRWDSIKHNTLSVAGLFWANKRLWINDPDFAVCRNPETSSDPDLQRLKACYVDCRSEDPFKEAHEYVLANATFQEQLVLLSLVLITGGAVTLSDNMPLLNEKGLFLARKVVSALSGYGTKPRDLFERELPAYWTQKLPGGGGRVLVINWSDETSAIPVDWQKMAPGVRRIRDFWTEETQKCEEEVTLAPHSCKLWEY